LVVAEKTRGALGLIELKDIVKGGIRDRFRPRSSSHQIIAEHDEKNRIPQRNTLLCHRRSHRLGSLLAVVAHRSVQPPKSARHSSTTTSVTSQLPIEFDVLHLRNGPDDNGAGSIPSSDLTGYANEFAHEWHESLSLADVRHLIGHREVHLIILCENHEW
jgi:hypothetical protein